MKEVNRITLVLKKTNPIGPPAVVLHLGKGVGIAG